MNYTYKGKQYKVQRLARKRVVLITDSGLLIVPYETSKYKRSAK